MCSGGWGKLHTISKEMIYVGYQESYVTAPNFQALVEVTNGLGKQFFEDRFVQPVLIITLNTTVVLSNESLQAGTQFLYFAGERQFQRNINELYDFKQPHGTKSWATEEFPSELIFADGGTFATLEGFKI